MEIFDIDRRFVKKNKEVYDLDVILLSKNEIIFTSFLNQSYWGCDFNLVRF